MNKKELIDQLGQAIELNGYGPMTKVAIEVVLKSLPSVIAQALARGDAVEIPGLVRLKREERAARTGRNPATGAAVQIPAKRVVKAKPVKALQDSIQ